MTKTNAFDTAQDIIDEVQEHYTPRQFLKNYKGDVLNAIDGMIKVAKIEVPDEHRVTVRARLGRWLRY